MEFFFYVEESRLPLWPSGQSSWLHKWDVLCLLWGTNWIYICYVEKRRPHLWSSGQSSWLQTHRSWFDFRRYQVFWEVMGLERGPLSLVSTIKELLGRKNCGFGQESGEYGRRDPSRWPSLTSVALVCTDSANRLTLVSISCSRLVNSAMEPWFHPFSKRFVLASSES
jgi:hypothetical protein